MAFWTRSLDRLRERANYQKDSDNHGRIRFYTFQRQTTGVRQHLVEMNNL
jgi:hypothetical protein